MRRSEKSYHWIYFFLHPFFALIHYLINFRNPAAKNIMWAFTVYFAMTIAIGKESQGSDINAYMEDVVLMSHLDFTWNSIFQHYQESGEIDVFRTFFSFLISRFTDNGYVLLIFFGFIYGYFYSRNMWLILDRLQGRLKPLSILLLFCMFMIVPIWNLGGFRFWTANHVFLFGLLPYLLTGTKKSLLWCVLTPFIFHYAFIVPLLVLIFYLILGNRLKIYFYFFIGCLLFGEINISFFNNLVESYAPTAFVERSSTYRSDPQLEAHQSEGTSNNKVWYIRYLNKFINWPFYCFLFWIYWKWNQKYFSDSRLLSLFCFTLLFYGFANLFATLPSGGRYVTTAMQLGASFLLIFFQNNVQERSINPALKIAFPFLAIFIIVKIRTSWLLMSLLTLIGNPAIAIFEVGENISINDIIKY